MEYNRVKKRLLFLPPSVLSGKERECRVDDFVSLTRKAIGEGAFGEVYKVRHKTSGNLFAIKVINKERILKSNLLEQIKREVRIMYNLSHPHIIKLYNHFEDDSNFYLILELAESGQLFTRLQKMKGFDEPTSAQFLREVALAVQYLHSRDPPIIHRDIKPENILLDRDGRAKVADFGWSNFFNDDTKRATYCGTLDYLAPEMIDRTGHTVKLDIWNLGVLLFEMLTSKAPFHSNSQTELFEKIRRVKIGFPKNFPILAKDLVKRLLRTAPEERINLDELFNHPWMKANPPTRPTVAPITDNTPLPCRLEDEAIPSEIENPIKPFNESEYAVVSKPSSGRVAEAAVPQSAPDPNLQVQADIKQVSERLETRKQALERLLAREKSLSEQGDSTQRAIESLRVQLLEQSQKGRSKAREDLLLAMQEQATLNTEIRLQSHAKIDLARQDVLAANALGDIQWEHKASKTELVNWRRFTNMVTAVSARQFDLMESLRSAFDTLKAVIRNPSRQALDRLSADVTLQVVSLRLQEKTELQRSYTKLLNSLEKREREVQVGPPTRSAEVDVTINLLRDGVKRLKVLEEDLEQRSRAMALAS